MNTTAERLLTVARASRESGLPEWTLRRLVRAGEIPSVLVGTRTRRVRLSEVKASIRESGEPQRQGVSE
jgi:excisionase family DNA binding protein